MGENQEIEKILTKLTELLRVENKVDVILTGRGSNEVLKISAEELQKLRQLIESVKNSVLGNFVNLSQPDKELKFVAQGKSEDSPHMRQQKKGVRSQSGYYRRTCSSRAKSHIFSTNATNHTVAGLPYNPQEQDIRGEIFSCLRHDILELLQFGLVLSIINVFR